MTAPKRSFGRTLSFQLPFTVGTTPVLDSCDWSKCLSDDRPQRRRLTLLVREHLDFVERVCTLGCPEAQTSGDKRHNARFMVDRRPAGRHSSGC